MVTHDMAEALLLADRVLVMDAGRIVADETPAALMAGAGGRSRRRWSRCRATRRERIEALMNDGASPACPHSPPATCCSPPPRSRWAWSSRCRSRSGRRATPRVARVALGFASLVQTIPGLALLALFYPLLLSLSALVGGGIPALGFLPSLLALALYALLPILRNAVTGPGRASTRR